MIIRRDQSNPSSRPRRRHRPAVQQARRPRPARSCCSAGAQAPRLRHHACPLAARPDPRPRPGPSGATPPHPSHHGPWLRAAQPPPPPARAGGSELWTAATCSPSGVARGPSRRTLTSASTLYVAAPHGRRLPTAAAATPRRPRSDLGPRRGQDGARQRGSSSGTATSRRHLGTATPASGLQRSPLRC